MNRRSLLVMGGAGLTAVLAGCSTSGSETTLSNPETGTNSGGGQYLLFEEDGTTYGYVGFGTILDTPRRIPVTVQTPPSGFEIANLRFRFAYVDPEFEHYHPPSIALAGPFAGNIGAETPTVSLYYPEDERGTVFEARDLGDLADQTFSIDLLHVDAPEPPRALGVVVTIELAEGGESGDRYTLRGTVRLDFQADASD